MLLKGRRPKSVFQQPANGRVYYDLCKRLYNHGYVSDILYWRGAHGRYIKTLTEFYDFFISGLDGVHVLLDTYGIPHHKIIIISHWTLDIQEFIDKYGRESFGRFAGYAVVGHSLLWDTLALGVPVVPRVTPLGINYAEFHIELSERLMTVGYAGSRSVKTRYGIELKRGELAEACAHGAGLDFRPAGFWTLSHTSIHDMPDYYRTVDALLVTSLQEGSGLPAVEAAAAGRLVISTPVGHFPLRAYQGGGIVAPLDSENYQKFVVDTLMYYKENRVAYISKCQEIQEAARKFDWEYSIDSWIYLIESAKSGIKN